MKISKMAKKIKPSLTRRLFDMAKKHDNVIDFTLGDPDFETPEYIKSAACNAINAGKTHYSSNAGLVELRKIVVEKVRKETSIDYDSDSEVMITVGAMEGIFLTLCALIDPEDEVIIPSPYWINYVHMTEMLGGKPVLVEADETTDFVVSAKKIEAAVSDKTVAIIINSPNNPTGTVYDKDTLAQICQLSYEKNITIIFDECYKSLLFDDADFTSILEFPDMKEHSVIVNSCSKRYAMTGWRVGYLVGPSEFISQLPKLQENIVACTSLPSQYAAIEALKNDDKFADAMRDEFEKRRNLLVSKINAVEGLSCKSPKGTFYVLVNIKETGLKSEDFSYSLLEKAHVAVVPGITYGEACEGYVRMAFTLNESKITEGVLRINNFIQLQRGKNEKGINVRRIDAADSGY